MKCISLKPDPIHLFIALFIANLDCGGIHVFIELSMHFQAFLRSGSGDQTYDHFQAGERLATPVLADEREQPSLA